jgi:hypothetical protein
VHVEAAVPVLTVGRRPEWTVAVPLLDSLLVVGLLAVVALRLAWIGRYYWTFLHRRESERPLAAVRRASRALTTHVYQVGGSPEQEAARRTRFFTAAAGQVDALLLIGSVALAAWTQLFSASGQEPGSLLAPITRHLLLISAAVLIIGPVLFRSAGGQLTFLGRESMMAVGFTALVFSLASAAADVFGTAGAVVTIVVVVAVVARDFAEMRLQLASLRYLATTPRRAAVDKPVDPPAVQPEPPATGGA